MYYTYLWTHSMFSFCRQTIKLATLSVVAYVRAKGASSLEHLAARFYLGSYIYVPRAASLWPPVNPMSWCPHPVRGPAQVGARRHTLSPA